MEESFASRYGELGEWHWWFRGRERILAAVLRRELAKGGAHAGRHRLVTVGSGPPEVLASLARRLGNGAAWVGVDADPSGALRRLRAEQPRGVAARRRLRLGVDRAPAAPRRLVRRRARARRDRARGRRRDRARRGRAPRPPGRLRPRDRAGVSLALGQPGHRRRTTSAATPRARSRTRSTRAGVALTWSSYFNSALFPAVAAVRWSRRLLGASEGAPTSDLESARPGAMNELLERVFAAERHLVGRVRLPAGVSLIAVARRPGEA